MKFYVRASDGDVPKGPFDIGEIVLHIENAWLPECASVASPGSHQWVPVTQVPELAVAFGRLREAGLAAPPAPEKIRPYVPPGQLSCPKCGSAARGGRDCLVVGLCLLLAPILIGIIMLLLIKPTYRCTACGHTFQP